MRCYFDDLEKIRLSMDVSIESMAKLIGVQPITYASWTSGTIPSERFYPQIANGFFLLSLLKHSGLIPGFTTSREKNQFYKSLASKGKIHTLMKNFCYFD